MSTAEQSATDAADQPASGADHQPASGADHQPGTGPTDWAALFDRARADRSDPHPLYHRVRTEQPVLRTEQGGWLLTRYGDCEAVLRDPRFSTNPQHMADPPPVGEASVRESMAESGSSILLFMDPPDHTRIRNLVNRNFTPKAIETWRPRVVEIVDRLLDEAAERGEMEVIGDFGFQVPVIVICELLGVPSEDRHLFGPWSSDASRLLDQDLTPAETERGLMGAMQLIGYLNPLIEDRVANPRDDLLSHIVAVGAGPGADGSGGDRLSEEELRSLVLLLFVAGHETTMNLIGNGAKALLEHPDQLARLRADPGLIDTAVEEILRYDGPVHLTGRIPTDDVEVAGQAIAKGTQVVALLAAANRDPAEFENPDRFDVGRTPNHHLAFSKGIHHCLGAALARVEGQIALGRLVERFGHIELRTTEPTYRNHFVLRGLDELHVELRP